MATNYYRTGQAAKQLDRSSHHIRQLCESGLIEAELTTGKQWKIPDYEIARLQQEGIPPIPQLDFNPANEVPAVKPYSASGFSTGSSPAVQAAEDDCAITEAVLRKRKLEREAEEVEDFFRDRQRRQKEEADAEQKQRAKALADTERRKWVDSWQAYALRSLPNDAPAETKAETCRQVAASLAEIGFDQQQYVVQQLVDAAISRSLVPYVRHKHREQAILLAVSLLPSEAQGWGISSKWELKAKQAAAVEIEKLDRSASYADLAAVANSAVEKVCSEFKNEQAQSEFARMRDEFLSDLQFWGAFTATAEERKRAVSAVAKAFETLPVCTGRTHLAKVRDEALRPFEIAVQERKETRAKQLQAESVATAHLSYIDRYVAEEFEFDHVWEKSRTVQRLRAEIYPLLVAHLCKEEDDVNEEDTRQVIRELVDDLLEVHQ